MKHIFNKIDKKSFSFFALLLTVQQILSTIALYLLTELTNFSANQKNLITYVGFFFVLMLLESFLVIPIRYFEIKGFFQTYKKWLDNKFTDVSGKTFLWINKDKKGVYTTTISTQMSQAITQLMLSFFEIYRYFLSLSFGGALLASILGAEFAIVFLTSILIASIFYIKSKDNLGSLTQVNQKSEVEFFSYISKSWDNILLGNKRCENLYRNKVDKIGNIYLDSSLKVFNKSEWIVFVTFMITIVPVSLYNIWFLKQNINNLSLVTSVLILLPKQFSILGNIKAIIQLFTFLKMDIERYKALTIESTIDSIDLNSLVTVSKISINGLCFNSIHEIRDHIDQKKSGRFTIRGTNGAGKTSLLLLLKLSYENSFYIPTTSELEIENPEENQSVGQLLKANLDFVLSSVDSQIIFLDEWDANLDEATTLKYNLLIDDLSKSRIVIEVRH